MMVSLRENPYRATLGERTGNRVSAGGAGRRGPFLEGRLLSRIEILPLRERAERERPTVLRIHIGLRALTKAGIWIQGREQ